MREHLEQLLIVLAVGSAVAIVARRISVPYNVALVVVGLVLVLLKLLPETPMDPGVVLMVFLPILIFQGALSADATSLRQAARPILALAVPGVAMSLLATATIATWEIGLPFSVALLLGAVLAITDTVSVLLAFRSVRVPHRLAAIMEGESLFNDGTALVLVGVAATGGGARLPRCPRDRADAVHRHRRRRPARADVRDARQRWCCAAHRTI